MISRSGLTVLKEELGLDWSGDEASMNGIVRDHFKATADRLTYYDEGNFFSPLASGSAAPEAMVVAPCSMGTLARIAAGLSANLLERAADVMLKEGKPLLLLPRETSLSRRDDPWTGRVPYPVSHRSPGRDPGGAAD